MCELYETCTVDTDDTVASKYSTSLVVVRTCTAHSSVPVRTGMIDSDQLYFVLSDPVATS